MYRAIVIDDEKWTLMGICRTFHWEEEGFEQPFSTTDPEEGLAQILAAPPDAPQRVKTASHPNLSSYPASRILKTRAPR